MNAADTERLATELARVVNAPYTGKFTDEHTGETFKGATESDVIKHLTSRRDYIAGRQFRFPGIGNGWVFSSAIEDAGFVIRRARNSRGQSCNVVTQNNRSNA